MERRAVQDCRIKSCRLDASMPVQLCTSQEYFLIGKDSMPEKNLAPQVGLEPTTLRLTAECSAIELLRSVVAGLCFLCVYIKCAHARQRS